MSTMKGAMLKLMLLSILASAVLAPPITYVFYNNVAVKKGEERLPLSHIRYIRHIKTDLCFAEQHTSFAHVPCEALKNVHVQDQK